RTVLHLAGRVRLGRDVRDLFQLQRALERHGKPNMPAEVEEERLVVEALGDLFDRVVGIEELAELRRQLVQLVEDELYLVGGQRLSNLGELERDQRQQRYLGRERLGDRKSVV